ncbi:hypothetical protein HPP92_027881 [Vanilla planifolia]|uniref:Ninja-family protein n=1 Tax=Vanilla planifolia TaxID=51239 RepID=A0A835P7M2_VANPL|nr:hypothetical protein HPP92_027881 [Vanilla planifolia]
MEDENGLELSLGLSFGKSSTKSNVKDVSSNPKGAEGNASGLMGENRTPCDDSFKNFFKSSLDKQESKGKQKSSLTEQSHENFFTDLAKCSSPMADCSNGAHSNLSQFTRYQELWISSNKNIENEEEKTSSSKRKMYFEERNYQKKHEKLSDLVDKYVNKPTGALSIQSSRVSIAMEDGSTGENEDVAESEVEVSKCWMGSQREENAKCSKNQKASGNNGLSQSSGIGAKTKSELYLSELEPIALNGKGTNGIQLSLQPVEATNLKYQIPSTIPSINNGPNAGFTSAPIIQMMSLTNSEGQVTPVANTNNTQLTFGYTSVQLPTLETGSSWAFNSQPMHVSPNTRKENLVGIQNKEQFLDGLKISQGAAPHNSTTPDPATIGVTCTAARAEAEARPRNSIHPTNNDATNKPTMECFSSEGASIRPGIAPNLKFGGSGSYPELPWVTTTGQGPNAKTISGVTYKYNQNQVKIVCACHGNHMTPEEFMQHANVEALDSEGNPNSGVFRVDATSSAQS